MTQETFTVRMRWKDYQRLRKIFPAYRKETTANYFNRLRLWLEIQEQLTNPYLINGACKHEDR